MLGVDEHTFTVEASSVQPEQQLGVRVLVVEDDSVNRHLLCEVCKNEGYSVVGVEDAIAAEVLLRKDRFDLVLLDYTLPDRSGLELLEILRADSIAVPAIVMISAVSVAATRQRALALGVSAFVEKPFRLFDLTHRVRRVLFQNAPEPSRPSSRMRITLADELSGLPPPNSLRPLLHSVVEQTWSLRGESVCVLVRLSHGRMLRKVMGDTRVDACLGSMVRVLRERLSWRVVRCDDHDIATFGPANLIDDRSEPSQLCAALNEAVSLLVSASNGTVSPTNQPCTVVLGVARVAPGGRRPPDAETVLRTARTLCSRAEADETRCAQDFVMPAGSDPP